MSASSAQNELVSVVSAVNVIQLTGYFQVAACAMLLYDYLLTFDQEVKYVWRSGLKPTTILYYIIRYAGSVVTLLNVVAFTTHQSQEFCQAYLLVQAWPVCFIGWLVQIVLQMRLYVLYNRSRTVFTIMLICFIAEIAALTTILVLADTNPEATNEPFPGVFTCAATNNPTILSDLWWAQIVFETILCGLAIYIGIRRSQQGYQVRPLGGKTIVDVLIMGNVSYFILIIIVAVANAIMLQIGLQWIEVLEGFEQSSLVVIGCRLIIHLRDIADRQSRGTVIATLPESQPAFSVPMSTITSGEESRAD